MKFKFTLVVLLMFLSGLLSGMPLPVDQPGKNATGQAGVTDTITEKSRAVGQLVTNEPKNGSEKSIYDIDVKENRTINNYFTRHFFTNYTNKNLRRTLIEKGNSLPGPVGRIYTRIVEKTFRYPFVIFFLAIIAFLILNVLTVIVILFITNLIMNMRSQRKARLRDIYEKVLTDLMLEVIDIREAISKLEETKIKKNNDLLIEVMMDFQKSFRGDADRSILDLYQELGLSKVSYDKTYSSSFYRQVLGIRELANMRPEQATEMISTRLNDKIDIVRTEAQICYPYVNTGNPFGFLSILERPFSRWAQLNIYYFIKIHELPVPSFEQWLKSDHKNVVNFCIMMIALFQQRENAGEIIRLVRDPDENIRREAIRTCSDLSVFESKDVLKDVFHDETLKNQLEIIRAFRFIGDDSDLPFLEATLQSEEKSLRLETCRTIYNLSESARKSLEEINQSMNFILSTYIAHIKDSRN